MKVENYFVYNKKSNSYLEIESIKFAKEMHCVVVSMKNKNHIDYFIKDCVFDPSKPKKEYAFEFGVYYKNEILLDFKGCTVNSYSTTLNLIEILYDYYENPDGCNFIDDLILEQKYL